MVRLTSAQTGKGPNCLQVVLHVAGNLSVPLPHTFLLFNLVQAPSPRSTPRICRYDSQFEPPTTWSRTRMTRKINNLDVGIGIEMDFDMLFQIKKLEAIMSTSVTRSHSVSMQGVGIFLGIVTPAILARLRERNAKSTRRGLPDERAL